MDASWLNDPSFLGFTWLCQMIKTEKAKMHILDVWKSYASPVLSGFEIKTHARSLNQDPSNPIIHQIINQSTCNINHKALLSYYTSWLIIKTSNDPIWSWSSFLRCVICGFCHSSSLFFWYLPLSSRSCFVFALLLGQWPFHLLLCLEELRTGCPFLQFNYIIVYQTLNEQQSSPESDLTFL